MPIINRNLILLALSISLSGCALSRVYVGPQDSMAGVSKNYDGMSLFWGIIPASPVNAAGACTSGVQKIVTKRGLGGWIVSTITVGIVKPQRVTITCIK
jgi:hypothetical protein